jgi:hypothetical protein
MNKYDSARVSPAPDAAVNPCPDPRKNYAARVTAAGAARENPGHASCFVSRMKAPEVRPSAFQPHGWLQNPVAQMAAGVVVRSRAALAPPRIERLETPDDDFVELAWLHETLGGPVAVLVHGLGGGHQSGYVHAMARVLAALGWTSVMLQLRGTGPEANRQPRILHHADTEDLRWICRRLRRRWPHRPLVLVGWSLGGSIVLNALGEERDMTPVDAAAVVCAPLQLRRCAEFLRRGSARVYQDLMLRYVKGLLRRKVGDPAWPRQYDAAAILAARDFFELGDLYTAPLCGYRDGREYCERADPGRRLRHIRRPTLVVQALDDPFLGPAVLPRERPSRAVRIEVAERGGHVGFIGPGTWGRPQSWLEPRIVRFLRAALRAQRPPPHRRRLS